MLKNSAGEYHLEGEVKIQQPGLVIRSNKIIINQQQQTIQAKGNIEIHSKDMVVTGEKANINRQNNTAEIINPKYQLSNSKAHGQSSQIQLDKEDMLSTLKEASFTTCKLTKIQWQARPDIIKSNQQYDWILDFNVLTIDDAKQRIYGKNTVLTFKKVPILYSPYISFSTAKRATGLLFPSFGSYKSITQPTAETYLSVPFYFNIAPEVDDTLTITRMQDRGNLLSNEFRYMQAKHSAVITTNFIRDQVSKRDGIASYENGQIVHSDPVEERWDMRIQARQQWVPGLSSDIDWRKVSDKNFYADLPTERSLNTATTVQRTANLNYTNGALNASISVLDYLRLRNDAPYNYTKRPEVSINYGHFFEQEKLQGLGFNIISEATEFEISEAAQHNKPEALRSYLSPSFEYSIIKPFGSIKTEVVANKVHYFMQDNGYNNTGADQHDITVPQFALRGGLVFEKNLDLIGNRFTQTLEPELQYLYVPFQDQSNIPLFDTTKQSLDFSNLFSYNRFSGLDRIGDTNQVSAALTSKLLDSNGTPLAEAGIGQIFYLAERKVQLNNSPLNSQTDKVSDYFVKLGFNSNHYSFHSTAQFSKENYELTNANSRLKLAFNPNFLFLMTSTVKNYNLPGEQEDASAGFNWRLNQNWSLGSYANYNFTTELKTETSTAIRYDSCCWASELSLKETQLAGGLYNYSIEYLIEFKGLSSVGTPFSDYLNDKLNF